MATTRRYATFGAGIRVVGAIVFGIDPEHPDTRTVFSLGVVPDRRREYIGTDLKLAALAEIGASGYDGYVYSQVHRYNKPMRAVNAGFNAGFFPDGKMLVASVKAIVTEGC